MSIYKVKAYDKDKDYQKEINEAVARGDKATAGNLERLRNAKIDGEGLGYGKTYNHIDLGTDIKQGMNSGAPAWYIQQLKDARENKANTNPYLKQFGYDEIQDAAARYINNGLSGVGVNYENRPQYESRYQSETDRLLDEVLSGKDFSYDANSDPVFQAYKEMYTREGERAMKDTLAQANINAGGDNSWAITAAAQAQNRYMQELSDKMPELYNLAYEMYIAEQNQNMNKLNLVRDMENNDYNRYLNEMGIYQTDREFANRLTENELNRNASERTWQQEFALNEINRAAENGNYVPQYLLDIAGITDRSYIDAETERNAKLNKYNDTIRDYELKDIIRNDALAQMEYDALRSYNVTVPVGSGGGGVVETKKGTKPSENNEEDNGWTKGMVDLGLGLVYSPDILIELANSGAIYEDDNGLHWIDGWNAQNYKSKLRGFAGFEF